MSNSINLGDYGAKAGARLLRFHFVRPSRCHVIYTSLVVLLLCFFLVRTFMPVNHFPNPHDDARVVWVTPTHQVGLNRSSLLLGTLEIQKTGSTKLRELFSGAINECSSQEYWLSSASEGFFFYTSDIKTVRSNGVPPHLNKNRSTLRILMPRFNCVAHHSDFENLDACLSSTAANIIYLTFLRNPVERVVSEFVHLRGNHPFREAGAWTTFQPSACNQTSFEQLHIPLDRDLQSKYIFFLRSEINKNITIDWSNHSALSTDFFEGGPASRLLHAWVKLGESNPANNRMARHLAGPYTCEEDIRQSLFFQKEWFVKSAVHNLKTRFIYGIQDDLQFSLRKMNCEVHCLLNTIRPHDDYIRNCFSMNVSQIKTASASAVEFDPNKDGHYKISAATQDLILRHNHLDQILYEFATEKNNVLRWCTEMC
mmetsp:Transcript_29166/g.43137  ORF Transcript_29166/g.43137 Transcript_29166/m.43137 type:complete len:426 (-) Transcript_29166:463-1740(-)